MLTTSVGGSTENDDTDVTVMPVMSLPRPTVITLTPPARWRMAPRKSTEETSRSILMLRTAEFMAASQVKCFVRGLEQVAQDRTFQRREIGRTAPARARDVDIDIVRDAAVFNDQHTIGERDRFGNIVRDQDRGEGLIMPDPLQQPLHRNTGQRIERAERLVESQDAGMADQRAGQRHALLLAAGQNRRPLTALCVEADFNQGVFSARLRIGRGAVATEADFHVGQNPRPRQQPRLLVQDRRAGAARFSCRSRCGRPPPRTGPRECAGRCRAAPRDLLTICAGPEWSTPARATAA